MGSFPSITALVQGAAERGHLTVERYGCFIGEEGSRFFAGLFYFAGCHEDFASFHDPGVDLVGCFPGVARLGRKSGVKSKTRQLSSPPPPSK